MIKDEIKNYLVRSSPCLKAIGVAETVNNYMVDNSLFIGVRLSYKSPKTNLVKKGERPNLPPDPLSNNFIIKFLGSVLLKVILRLYKSVTKPLKILALLFQL